MLSIMAIFLYMEVKPYLMYVTSYFLTLVGQFRGIFFSSAFHSWPVSLFLWNSQNKSVEIRHLSLSSYNSRMTAPHIKLAQKQLRTIRKEPNGRLT